MDRAGRSPPTADMPWGTHKITGLGDPTNAQDAVTKNYGDTTYQFRSNSSLIATAAGTADVITAAFTPAIMSLTNGLRLEVRAASANATTTPTFQADSTAAKTIVKGSNTALVAGNIPGVGYWMILTYDGTLDKWVLDNPVNLQPASPVPAAFKNLSIKVATNTTVACAADFVTMTDGTNYFTSAVSGTINLGTNGAVNTLDAGTIAIDTWYYIWAIGKSDQSGSGWLASTSLTTPTFPTGYTYKARLGAVRTIHASATLYGTWQLGRRAQYVVGLAQTSALPVIASGSAGTYSTTAPTYVSASVSGLVPSTASVLRGVLGAYYNGNAFATAIVAPNASYSGIQSNNAPPVVNANVGVGASAAMQFEVVLESTNIYWANNGAGGVLYCMGWEDNI